MMKRENPARLGGRRFSGHAVVLALLAGGGHVGANAALSSPPALVINAAPGSVVAGKPYSVSWAALGASSCEATGAWLGHRATTGHLSVSQDGAGAYNYKLTCTGRGGSVTRTATVNVAQSAAPAISLSAWPKSVELGQSATILWSAPYALSCRASGAWSGIKGTSGSQAQPAVSLGEHVYTLACLGPRGNISQSVTVMAKPVTVHDKATAYQISPDHSGEMIYAKGVRFPSAPLWSRSLGSYVSHPLIADGRVFVTTSAGSVETGTDGRNAMLFALDEHTGNDVWGPIPNVDGSTLGAAYENGTVFVLNGSGRLTAYDAATGNLNWSLSVQGNSFSAPPTASGGIVYFSGYEQLVAVDESSGQVLWKRAISGSPMSTPSVTADGVYFSISCEVYDLSPYTGEVIWNVSGSCEGGGSNTVVVKNGAVYVRDSNGDSNGPAIYDAATGAYRGPFFSSAIPAVSARSSFSLAGSTLSAVDLKSGALLWNYTVTGYLAPAPIVINGYVIIGTGFGNLAGTVIAVDATTGKLAWSASPGAAILPAEAVASQVGMASGEGLVGVPAGGKLTAWSLVEP